MDALDFGPRRSSLLLLKAEFEIMSYRQAAFWGWLFQFVGQMRVLSPERVAEEYRQRAKVVAEK